MQEAQSIIDIKLLLGFITILLGSNIALIIFIAKKHIKRADKDHDRLNAIYGEHLIFHKKDTGLNNGR